ncbi:hypothetical protein ACP70R_044560 [Stipagrostis hirtigluma subsp. patula]
MRRKQRYKLGNERGHHSQPNSQKCIRQSLMSGEGLVIGSCEEVGISSHYAVNYVSQLEE